MKQKKHKIKGKKRWEEIIARLPKNKKIIGAEIGVWKGVTSKALLASLPNLYLYLVDRWAPPPAGDSYHEGSSMMAKVSQAGYAEAYQETLKRIKPLGKRATIMVMHSLDAATHIPDGSLDFLFLDADHSFDGLSADLHAWVPKVKPGGLVAGHDWENDNTTQEVKRAVLTYLGTDAVIELGHDHTWFWRVPK